MSLSDEKFREYGITAEAFSGMVDKAQQRYGKIRPDTNSSENIYVLNPGDRVEDAHVINDGHESRLWAIKGDLESIEEDLQFGQVDPTTLQGPDEPCPDSWEPIPIAELLLERQVLLELLIREELGAKPTGQQG